MRIQYGLIYYAPESREELTLPLQNVHANIEIVDMVAQVTISQTYSNATAFMLEAIYKFPLPENAAVNAFNVDFGNDRKIVGKVEEKQVARQQYQNALAAGDGAYLLEEKLPDIFEMKVGNLAPSETLTVNIRYVQELANDTLTNDLIRFSLPTTIAPRYVPRGTSLNDQEKVSVVYSEFAGSEYVLTLDVTCTMTGRVLDIKSTTHDVTTLLDTDAEGDGKIATATLKNGYTYLNKDFVLLIKAENLDDPRAFSEYNEETDTHCVMLTMVPRFALTEVRSELIFVVDRSGSMAGAKITRTAEALTLFLRSLPEDCFFNVISFGSSHQPLFRRGSSPYSPDTLQQALKLAQGLDASLGGTEIHKPLEWAFSKARSDVSTTVLLLTDGEVGNTDAVIKLTNRHVRELKKPKGLRLFTLGIGNAVSHHLVDGLARAGRGYSQYVGETERLERKVVQMLKNALQPPITDYKVTWTGKKTTVEEKKSGWSEGRNTDNVKPEAKKRLSFFNPNVKIAQNDIPAALPSHTAPSIRQTPHYIPVILPHTRLIVYCFLAPGRQPAKTILLEAQSNDGPIELEVDLEQAAPGSLIHTLAARRMIAEMEEGTSYLHHDESGMPLRHVAEHIIQREIVTMGVQFSLATLHTSFIAIDKRGDENEIRWEQVVTVHVPSDNPDSSLWSSPMTNSAMAYSAGPSPVVYYSPMVQSAGPSKKMKVSKTSFMPAQRASLRSRATSSAVVESLSMAPPPPGAMSYMAPPSPGGMSPYMAQSMNMAESQARSPSVVNSARQAPPQYHFMDMSVPSRYSSSGRGSGDVSGERRRASNSSELNHTETQAIVPRDAPDRLLSIQDLYKLIEFQAFNGEFTLTDELVHFLGFANAQAFLTETRLARSEIENDNVWITVYVVAFLHERMTAFKDEWELVAAKALKSVAKRSQKTGEELVAEARNIIQKP